MSNFIDHWLNSTPIEEATRAKKLKKQGKISPEDYAKAEQSLEQKLSKYVTKDPEKMHYITFISDMSTAKEIGDDDIPPPAPGEVDIRRKGRKIPITGLRLALTLILDTTPLMAFIPTL